MREAARGHGHPCRPGATNALLSIRQCDDKDFRGPSWRRQFPPRDIHGISMMPGSAETLPAGFRLTATSGHSRRLPPEGKRPRRRGRGFQRAAPVSARPRPSASSRLSAKGKREKREAASGC